MNIRGRVISVALLVGATFAMQNAHAQVGDPDAGKKAAKVCQSCHKWGKDAKNAFGPVLSGVVNRQAGSFEGYKYSPSLKAAKDKGLVWSEELLAMWLKDPSKFLKEYLDDPKAKSKMPMKVPNEKKRRDIAAFLATLKVAEEQTANKGDVTHGDAPHHEAIEGGMVSAAKTDDLTGMERVQLKLVKPPFVPEHTQTAPEKPRIVEISLTVKEQPMVIDGQGTEIRALTFEGSIPGPLLVVHQNDIVELTLKNPASNVMVHNIDLHAATGALGGAGLTTISPGEEAVLRFKADKAGVFLYHCAPEGSMTPYHVTHGMTGAILVLPRDGLKDDKGNKLTYDKAYYIGENDFYVPRDEEGNYKKYDAPGDDFTDWVAEMHKLTPSHVVFNGRIGALTGKAALKAKVGDNVLFLHVQGNRDTRPHLIGGHGDFVWETGSFASPPLVDLETWFIRGGSAGAALYKFRQPGVYVYLNHNLIEAVELGAAAHVVVEGEWDEKLMKQVYKGPLR